MNSVIREISELESSNYSDRSFIAFFDCDGTLTTGEGSWPAIHSALGTDEFRERELDRYLRNEQTYREWTIRTAKEWQGKPINGVSEAFKSVEMTAGLKKTIEELHRLDAVVGIVSAGVEQFVELVGKEGGFDFVIANRLGVNEGKFDGTVNIKVTDESKPEVYGDIVDKLNMDIKDVVMVGDSIHDVHEIHPKNLSIAYDPADDQTAEEADVSIYNNDLTLIHSHIETWI